MDYMRVWKELKVEDVQNHIIMVEDKFGHCPGCKQIGIELKELKNCPGCGREFKYVTSKDARGGKTDIVSRTRKKLPDLIFVDYDDYERVTGKKKAESLFNI
jgi:NADH pyrophosphatase NudC (nudix superfamily)